MYSLQSTATFDLPQQQQQQNEIEFSPANYQRHDSMDYSRRPSYFTGLLGGNNHSESSYSDHEQQTPSPFNSYEDYNNQYHHPLDNSQQKRRSSTLVELPQLYQPVSSFNWINPTQQQQQRCNSSPMIYANPAVDMYSPQTYLNGNYNNYHPLCTPMLENNMVLPQQIITTEFRERASSSSSLSSDSSLESPPMSRRTSSKQQKSPLKPTRSRGRRVSNSPSIAGQKVFTCKHDDCGKVFKRSEHLKRHVRSIHTLEKPFECPYQSCSKRFSRSDNLNQHIRIHRHTGKDKNNSNNNAAAVVTPAVRNNSFSNYTMPSY